MTLKGDIKAECSQEIKKALQGNVDALQTNIAEYSNTLEKFVNKSNKKMNEYNKKMQFYLNDFDRKKKELFEFDGIRSFLFWGGQLINIATFVTLMIFLFRG